MCHDKTLDQQVHRHRNEGGGGAPGAHAPPQVFCLFHAHSICPVLQIHTVPPQLKSLSYTSEVVVDQVDEGGMGGVDQQGDDEVDMVGLGRARRIQTEHVIRVMIPLH